MNSPSRHSLWPVHSFLHLALLEIPHAEVDTCRSPPVHRVANRARTPGLSLARDHLARSVPLSLVRRPPPKFSRQLAEIQLGWSMIRRRRRSCHTLSQAGGRWRLIPSYIHTPLRRTTTAVSSAPLCNRCVERNLKRQTHHVQRMCELDIKGR